MTIPCSECGKHPAIYQRTRVARVSVRKDHDLCQQCHRAAWNRLREGKAYGLPHTRVKKG